MVSATTRILTELNKLKKIPPEDFIAYPLEDNIFEWHFTFKGPNGSDFKNGLYHGKVILPQNYPMKAPDIIMLTPSGRFEIGRKICLSNTSYHPETWSPLWTIRMMIESLYNIMPNNEGGIGHFFTSELERKR